MTTTLILGAGIFGASTAYHLSLSTGSSPDRVILLDRASIPDKGAAVPSPAASWDWNKIVRTDYSDGTYSRIMKDGMEAWNDPSGLWKPFFVKSGVLYFIPESNARCILQNFESAGHVPPGAEMMSVDDARARGLFPDLVAEEDLVLWSNPNSGFAMAKEALAATVLAAVENGVEYMQGEVVKLRREGQGAKCTGAVLANGSEVMADRVVICLGAGSVRVLEASGADVAVGDHIRAHGFAEACITSGLEGVNEATRTTTAVITRHDWHGSGFFPAGPAGTPAKFYHDIAIRRDIVHPVSGSRVSVPPSSPDYDMWVVPQPVRDMLQSSAVHYFGPDVGSKIRLERHRICWDLSTRNGDFIISPVGGGPRGSSGGTKPVEGLFVASGGSFHGFKFLPIIGRYVVDMLDGKLEDELAEKWSWTTAMMAPTEGDWSGGSREKSWKTLGFEMDRVE